MLIVSPVGIAPANALSFKTGLLERNKSAMVRPPKILRCLTLKNNTERLAWRFCCWVRVLPPPGTGVYWGLKDPARRLLLPTGLPSRIRARSFIFRWYLVPLTGIEPVF